MMYYDDYEQLRSDEKEEKNSLENKLVAISNSLAKSQIEWTITEKKLFVMVLTKLVWKDTINEKEIELDKKEIMEVLGTPTAEKNTSLWLRKQFKSMVRKSMISWTDPNDSEIYEDGMLFTLARSTRGKMYVTINEVYKPHLEMLINNYTFFLADDVYGFKSSFAYDLFKVLNMLYDKRTWKNKRDFSTKQLKELFGLSKDDYMRPKEKGGFDRYNFEKYCVKRAVDEINNGEMVQIWNWGKTKKGGHVMGYFFEYSVKTKRERPVTDNDIDGQIDLFDVIGE